METIKLLFTSFATVSDFSEKGLDKPPEICDTTGVEGNDAKQWIFRFPTRTSAKTETKTFEKGS
jgi:hypothetical protein